MITTKEFCRREYGFPMYKICFDAGFSCPNRDGSICLKDGTPNTHGCIFCSAGGSGDFSVNITSDSLSEDIEKAKALVSKKFSGDKYIAYFQAFTNTYAPKKVWESKGFSSASEYLESIYLPVITREDIGVLSIATRPDCLDDEIYDLLDRLNKIKPVWVELGLQTSKPESVDFIRRGYPNEVYKDAVKRLNSLGIHVITHVILFLPGESLEDMLSSVRYAVESGTAGIKLQLLQVLKGTELAEKYKGNPFRIPSVDEYAYAVKKCIDIIPEDVVIHRITGDPPRNLLIEPAWAKNKKMVLNKINDLIRQDQSTGN